MFTTRFGSLPEIGNTHAFYWENFDAEQMKTIFLNALKEIKNNTEYEQRVKQYAQSFSWEKAAESYFNLYKN